MSEDDRERIACTRAGQVGHLACGVCPSCARPRFHCGHLTPASSAVPAARGAENEGES